MADKWDGELCMCMRRMPRLRKMLSKEKITENVKTLKLAAHPTRLQILKVLSECDVCVCILSELLGKSQPNISQHLSKLKDNGLIESYHKGKYVYYRISDRQAAGMMKALNQLPVRGS